ncbi:MAG: ComF family protein [Actinomycetota bacterium]
MARDVLMTFKLGGERRAARSMAAIMMKATAGLRAEVVTYVPSTRAQLAERGFNTAHELARALARDMRRPCRGVLVKVRATADQAGLGRDQRRRNQAGAFRARTVRGSILLVDDVMTTGATADACARALRSAGAAEVAVVTFARAGD